MFAGRNTDVSEVFAGFLKFGYSLESAFAFRYVKWYLNIVVGSSLFLAKKVQQLRGHVVGFFSFFWWFVRWNDSRNKVVIIYGREVDVLFSARNRLFLTEVSGVFCYLGARRYPFGECTWESLPSGFLGPEAAMNENQVRFRVYFDQFWETCSKKFRSGRFQHCWFRRLLNTYVRTVKHWTSSRIVVQSFDGGLTQTLKEFFLRIPPFIDGGAAKVAA